MNETLKAQMLIEQRIKMPFDMYNLTPLSLLHRARIGVFQAAFRAAKERMPTTIRSTAARATPRVMPLSMKVVPSPIALRKL
jgi:hypothetical protein